VSGALVISIDYERRWGVLHRSVDGTYRHNLLGVPDSVRGTLEMFGELGIAATWATVGFLMARTRAEREAFSPATRPDYRGAVIDPYREVTGEDEASDPFHYGASLIPLITATPRQELATHTFSHLYSLAPGVTREAFRADLESAIAITVARAGVRPRSIVFPRNEHNPAFDDVLLELGIRCFRGVPKGWMWRSGHEGLITRIARFVDASLPLAGAHTLRWDEIPRANGTFNVAASYFVRPLSGSHRRNRIRSAIRHAAQKGEVVHIWWHPHNYGVRTRENLAILRSVLGEFARCREEFGMQSMTMLEAADEAARRCGVFGATHTGDAIGVTAVAL
jgi:hypothetical protein